MTRLLILSLFAVAALAQPVTVTCDDGRVIAITPFNQDPCSSGSGAETVEEEIESKASTMPDGFLLAYGLPPVPTGNSLKDRVARVKYEQDMQYFDGLVAEPEDFNEVAAFYARWGLGAPVFMRGRYGEYCRWPEAPFRPMQATMFAAVHGAGVVVASWQARLIREGHVLTDVHAFVPPALVKLNRERLQASLQ